jgi:hypothetical protein
VVRWLQVRLLLYIITSGILARLVEIWKLPVYKMILLIFWMVICMIVFENPGVFYERRNQRK